MQEDLRNKLQQWNWENSKKWQNARLNLISTIFQYEARVLALKFQRVVSIKAVLYKIKVLSRRALTIKLED
jgi:hypothetical protein